MPVVVRHKRKDSLDFLEERSDEVGDLEYVETVEDLEMPGNKVADNSEINLEQELEMKRKILEAKKRNLEIKMRDLELERMKVDKEENSKIAKKLDSTQDITPAFRG